MQAELHQVEGEKAIVRNERGQFLPGSTAGIGRPAGVPNRAAQEVREAARAIIEDPEYLVSLRKRLLSGEAPHMETLLWHYAFGKPKETVKLEGEVSVSKVVREIIRPDDVHVLARVG